MFWLARYAYNQLAPALEEARRIEPSIYYRIELDFQSDLIVIAVHWDREGMFEYNHLVRAAEDVDRSVKRIRRWTRKHAEEAVAA